MTYNHQALPEGSLRLHCGQKENGQTAWKMGRSEDRGKWCEGRKARPTGLCGTGARAHGRMSTGFRTVTENLR